MSDTKVDRWLLEVVGATRPPAEMPRAGVLVLGSDSRRAGYVVPGTDVEGAHCAIGRMKGGGFALKDLGSRGGTFLNGRRVESARLAAGDEIGIGTATLRVVDPENPALKPSRAPRPVETQELEGERAARDAAHLASGGTPIPGQAPAPVATPTVAPASSRVEAPPAKSTNGTGSSDSGSSRSVPLPSIPGYRIERRLGRGGMGDVYLAVQESLARQVALKVLAARFEADREFVRRFQAEARAAAALHHPNVVTVFDVGEAGGKHYLSMEYMDRGNLEDRLKNGARMSEPEVLDVLRDATTGLVYADARGIVHRDLKPANLMQNHVGAIKIADLGLATHVESEEAQVGDKKVFGTPHFMSPEQARGERVDSRSDLFSLGATAYRLLTGKTPFEGKEAREIVRALLRDEPKPMRDSVPELSDGVVALVDRLMKKDPAQRFASAAEVLKEIERLRTPLPHAVSIAGEPAPVKKKSGGRVVLVLLLLGVGGWWYWQAKQDQAKQGTELVSGGSRPQPDELPEPDETTPVAPTPPDRPIGTSGKEKDDKDLQLLEANAKLALLELKQKQMTPAERRDELRILASRYQGTSAASEALAAADDISNEMQSAEVARAAKKIEVDAIMQKLRAAARIDDVPPHPGRSFIDMRAVEGQAALREDPQFIEARKSLETLVSRTAVQYAKQLLSDATVLMDKGDYDGGMKKFAELMPVFDLPEFTMGEAPAGVSELFDIGRTARERMHTFEASRDVFERRRDHDDALAIAVGFGGPGGLEKELRSLDFEAARVRLEGLVSKVAGASSQAFLKEQAADCARARGVIETLARECAAGNWRRKGFTDPRDKKGATRNAVGADETGLLYEGPGGVADHVPWSAFGGNTKEIGKLFSERCTREWTAEEMHAITALLRMTACIEAIDVTAKMFDGTKKANFTEANHKELADAFGVVATWTQSAPAEREETAREAAAAKVLGTTLRLTTEEKWSAAVAETERLITGFKDSLLVRLLSNGTDPDAVK